MSDNDYEKKKLLDEIKSFESENEHVLANITRLKLGNKRLRLEFAVLLEQLERLSKTQNRDNIDELPTLKNLTKDLNIATNSVLQYIIDNVAKPREQKKQEFLNSFVKQQNAALSNLAEKGSDINIKSKLKQIVLEATLLNSKPTPGGGIKTKAQSSRGGRKRKITQDANEKEYFTVEDSKSDNDLKKRKHSLNEIENLADGTSANKRSLENHDSLQHGFDLFYLEKKGSSFTQTELEDQWDNLDEEMKNKYVLEAANLQNANNGASGILKSEDLSTKSSDLEHSNDDKSFQNGFNKHEENEVEVEVEEMDNEGDEDDEEDEDDDDDEDDDEEEEDEDDDDVEEDDEEEKAEQDYNNDSLTESTNGNVSKSENAFIKTKVNDHGHNLNKDIHETNLNDDNLMTDEKDVYNESAKSEESDSENKNFEESSDDGVEEDISVDQDDDNNDVLNTATVNSSMYDNSSISLQDE